MGRYGQVDTNFQYTTIAIRLHNSFFTQDNWNANSTTRIITMNFSPFTSMSPYSVATSINNQFATKYTIGANSADVNAGGHAVVVNNVHLSHQDDYLKSNNESTSIMIGVSIRMRIIKCAMNDRLPIFIVRGNNNGSPHAINTG